MMTNGRKFDREANYEIKVTGVLDVTWTDWLDGFTIIPLENETILRGTLVDQAALSGLVASIIGLGMTVISVQRIRED